MREWQIVKVTSHGGGQDEALMRREEAERFVKECKRKMPMQMRSKEERVEQGTGFVIPDSRTKPYLVKHLVVQVDELAFVSASDWDHSAKG